jgi:SAM-dependent methyltransferase
LLLTRLRRIYRAATSPPGPGSERDRAFYDRRYATKPHNRLPYHLSRHYYPLWSIIADRVRSQSGVLEVGCGGGQLAALLRDQGLRLYIGFDFSSEAIGIARRQAPELTFHIADAFDTDLFSTTTYDTIISTEVLEHIDQDRALIQRWPSGVRCLCSVPDFPGKAHVRYFNSADHVRDRYADLFADLQITTHVRPAERSARFFLLDGSRR